MNRLSKTVDIFFLLLIMTLFLLMTFLFIQSDKLQFIEYLLSCITFIIITISFFTNSIVGMIVSGIFIFLYGTYILYQGVLNNPVTLSNVYIWFFIFPVVAFVSGRLGDYIKELQSNMNKLEHQVESLVTIDETTGFNNMKEFIRDLDEEMCRAKRHDFGLVLMLIEIQYYDELLTIYGKNKTEEIMESMAELVKKITRNEDKRYKIDKKMFAVIMPNTSGIGAKIVMERFKEAFENKGISTYLKEEKLKFDIKVGLVEFNDRIKSPFHFKEIAEKELEFDV